MLVVMKTPFGGRLPPHFFNPAFSIAILSARSLHVLVEFLSNPCRVPVEIRSSGEFLVFLSPWQYSGGVGAQASPRARGSFIEWICYAFRFPTSGNLMPKGEAPNFEPHTMVELASFSVFLSRRFFCQCQYFEKLTLSL